MKNISLLLSLIFIGSCITFTNAQQASDSLLQNATLQNCINYALSHQPSIQQSLLDEKITNQEIKTKLADWFPQINFNFNFQHNYKLPTSIIEGRAVTFGIVNTSSAQFSVSQTIFNKDVLLASSSAHDVREQASQLTSENKISLVVNVSKAYYAVLAAEAQIDLVNQDISRLEISLKDAYNQYKSGVVDKTDYMRATIALNNANAQKLQADGTLKTSYALLKQVMGYPSGEPLKPNYNTDRMENDVNIDTTLSLNYENRIEYKLLTTQRRLQKANLDYYIWSFFPSLTAFGEYNFNFQNNNLPDLYKQNFPAEYVGLQLSFPIFQGGKRIQEIDQAKLELERNSYDFISLKHSIYTQYTQSLSSYRSSLKNYLEQKDNLKLAKDVYNTIQLQYKSGIKTYLDVITSETDLRTTQVNYINALYQVLSSKLDLEKALGTIKY